MNLSWLAKHAFDVSGPKKMRQFAFEKFGQLAIDNDLTPDDIARAEAVPHDITRAEAVPDARTVSEWRRAVAEELLVAKTIGADIPNEQIEHSAHVSPFGADGPPLGQLLGRNTGVAVIPLDGRDGPPGCPVATSCCCCFCAGFPGLLTHAAILVIIFVLKTTMRNNYAY